MSATTAMVLGAGVGCLVVLLAKLMVHVADRAVHRRLIRQLWGGIRP
jgi:hypothetical protein